MELLISSFKLFNISGLLAIFLIVIWTFIGIYKKYTDDEKSTWKRLVEAFPIYTGLLAYLGALVFAVYGVLRMFIASNIYNNALDMESVNQLEVSRLTTEGSVFLGISGILISFGLSLTFYCIQQAQQRNVNRIIEKRIGKNWVKLEKMS